MWVWVAIAADVASLVSLVVTGLVWWRVGALRKALSARARIDETVVRIDLVSPALLHPSTVIRDRVTEAMPHLMEVQELLIAVRIGARETQISHSVRARIGRLSALLGNQSSAEVDIKKACNDLHADLRAMKIQLQDRRGRLDGGG